MLTRKLHTRLTVEILRVYFRAGERELSPFAIPFQTLSPHNYIQMAAAW